MTDEIKQPLDYYQEPWTKKFLNGPGPLILIIGLIVIGAYLGNKHRGTTVETVKYELPSEIQCQPRMSYIAYTKVFNELIDLGFEPVMDQQLSLVTRLAQNGQGTLVQRDLFVCRDSVISTKYSTGKVSFYRSGK